VNSIAGGLEQVSNSNFKTTFMKAQLYLILLIAITSACSKKDKDITLPIDINQRPLQLILDESESGVLEDEDKIELAFTFVDQFDTTGNSLEGQQYGHSSNLRVTAQLTDEIGFTNYASLVTGVGAFYEIDDCATSDDLNIDLNPTIDFTNQTISFDIPAGQTEVIFVLEIDPAVFDNDVIDNDRGFSVSINNLEGNGAGSTVKYVQDQTWEVKILDDEAIYGAWAYDHNDPTLTNFLTLFGNFNEEITGLTAADIDEIEFEVELDEVKVKIVLVETEIITECGTSEEVNKEIEFEFDLDELTDALNGEMLLITEIEDQSGKIEEFEVSATFNINASNLSITFTFENDSNVIEYTFDLTK
jgi:hypothetical protein